MDITNKIETIISPSLTHMGFSIVRVSLEGGEKRKTLSLMTERNDGKMMSIEDCTEISRTVSALLDVEDPIATAYNLEVCSPGIDRPLVKFADFERFAGYEIKLETLIPISGRKRFKGKLLEAKDQQILIQVDNEGYEIPFSNIRTAKLVMTDELVDSFMKQQKKQAKKS